MLDFLRIPTYNKIILYNMDLEENMNDIIKQIGLIGIVPVIALDRTEDAQPLAGALIEGGLPCAEVTFRTAAAEESIRIMAEKYPELLVGAGTVLTPEQADRAVAAGAKFIVSPGLNPKVVAHCIEIGIPVVPGCATPSDIETALGFGLDVVKFFPAEPSGGIAMIKALAGPYVNVRFMPTGGINAKNVTSYLDYEKIVACGGTWMIDKAMIKAGDFAGIARLTREAVNAMLGFRVRSSASAALSPFFGNEGRGTVIETNYIDRAMDHLGRRGVKFDDSTAIYDGKKLISIKVSGTDVTLAAK